jgi:hypothetical protein
MTEVVASLSTVVLGVYMKIKLGRIWADLVFKLRGNLSESGSGNRPQLYSSFLRLLPLKP